MTGTRRFRAKNDAEQEIFTALAADGYAIVKRGWPNCFAVREDGNRCEVVGIVVNGPRARVPLSPPQQRMAALLGRYGIRTEVRVASVDGLHPALRHHHRTHERGDIGG